MTASPRHLLGVEALDPATTLHLLDAAGSYFDDARRGAPKSAALRGKTVINVFYESSTRTRTSFEIAGKRLSADVINVPVSTSSVGKGESLLDTARTLDAMLPDVIVLRHPASGAAEYIARHTRASVVNAGDGMHEHPTQALLDAFTIRRHKGRFAGLVVAIVGDLAHSRVARSNALLLSRMGATVRFCAPATLMPAAVDAFPVTPFLSVDQALAGADVVMMLRIQRERLGGALVPSSREYSRTYGLNPRRLSLARPDAIVMHPGPMNRGVEIDPHLADGPQSVILDQVEAGVAVRMAVLARLVGTAEAAA